MERPKMQKLSYDLGKWIEIHPEMANTLQVFITERCNLRCPECYNMQNLGVEDMSLEFYKKVVAQYIGTIERIVLSGGEPTLHKQIKEIIRFNYAQNMKTTIYTNGVRLDHLTDIPLDGLSVRVSIFGISNGVKALRNLKPYQHLPVKFAYMLKKDNVGDLLKTAQIIECEYSCEDLIISPYLGEDYSTEYANTLPFSQYPDVVNRFLAEYDGKMTIHFATRGVIQGYMASNNTETCRFGNIFMNKFIQCPLDIQKNLTTSRIEFGTVKCNKNDKCVLPKIIFKRAI